MTKSVLDLQLTNSIAEFRKGNITKITSEKIEGNNCVYFKLKNGTTEVIRDYYDFTINGKELSSYLCSEFWQNSKSIAYNPEFKFKYHWVGYIGSFNKFWDRIKLLSLLRIKYEKDELVNEEFVKNYLTTVNKEHHEEIIQSILEQLNNSEVPIYGCRICGDKECGTLNIKIKRENDVIWTFTEQEKTLKWIFDIKEYELVLKKHIEFVS